MRLVIFKCIVGNPSNCRVCTRKEFCVEWFSGYFYHRGELGKMSQFLLMLFSRQGKLGGKLNENIDLYFRMSIKMITMHPWHRPVKIWRLKGKWCCGSTCPSVGVSWMHFPFPNSLISLSPFSLSWHDSFSKKKKKSENEISWILVWYFIEIPLYTL